MELETIIWQNARYRCGLVQDNDATSPRDADNLGVIALISREAGDDDNDAAKHAKTIMEENDTATGAVAAIRDELGATVVIPLAVQSHGYTQVFATTIDSGIHGFLFDTPATREMCGTPAELIEECLRGELDELNKWLSGDTYGIVVQERVTWTPSDPHYSERETWETVDSCWGFIGQEWAEEAAKADYSEEAYSAAPAAI